METPSTMIPLGTTAPDFTLLDTVSGKSISLAEIKSAKATVIMFLSNHCPYVKYIQTQLVAVAKHYQQKDISFIAICSNDITTHPADGPSQMKQVAQQHGFTFPYFFDETQAVARAYHAACTPDFFIFDKDLKCVYRGQFDAARPGNKEAVTGKDLADALDNILAGKSVSSIQHPSMGCNIKWKK